MTVDRGTGHREPIGYGGGEELQRELDTVQSRLDIAVTTVAEAVRIVTALTAKPAYQGHNTHAHIDAEAFLRSEASRDDR